MFDFPQPGEIYHSTATMTVRVIGVLEHGIPHELPYRCPGLVWNPYTQPYTILICIFSDDRITEMSLGHFLREFRCEHPDLFKRSPENRHAVLKEIAADQTLQKWRNKNIDIYPAEVIPVRRPVPVACKPVTRQWQNIRQTLTELKPDNSYRHYL
ncbi:hypothetical protein DCF38_15020 [Edwardsiella piscicida]|uniref:hypothetical protein n=1 Tax=Edwardsiella piscicida TaxID=1263550 RepID=UPI000D51E173|nr:hypothetical protein [Edwardsiella piscicida]UCQ40792.1 hypothetical protein DCF38_15020 [Edwardsiella piscicida]